VCLAGEPNSRALGDRPGALAFSPDGHLLAVANASGSVSVYELGAQGPREIAGSPFRGLQSNIDLEPTAAAFSPNGHLLAVGTRVADEVELYHVAADGKLTMVTEAPHVLGTYTSALAFSPNSRLLATADTGEGQAHAQITVWRDRDDRSVPIGRLF
jgi:6-phosphogluconolactonase (cycloisomerase 2 family)